LNTVFSLDNVADLQGKVLKNHKNKRNSKHML
jgi:hypothetical protein